MQRDTFQQNFTVQKLMQALRNLHNKFLVWKRLQQRFQMGHRSGMALNDIVSR